MAQAAVKSVMFVWEGRDKQGKKIKGEMSGTSDALVKAMLRRQGINPMRVKKKSMPLFGAGGKSITPKDIAIFSRQLATMMSSGVPLVQSFEIVGKGHENPRMQKLILDVKGKRSRIACRHKTRVGTMLSRMILQRSGARPKV